MRCWCVVLFLLMLPVSGDAQVEQPPNILVILADDLGYGDGGCYNAASKVPTPHLDRLAEQGLRFTDAHSPATVCTPSRYSLLTGRMAFRLNYRGVFTGVGGPCLIESDQLTLPGMLKQQGYRTALFGKWHVGMTFFDQKGEPIHEGGLQAVQRADFSRAIPDGPVHRGFDQFFGTACCPTTDFLYAFIENDRIPVPPVELLDRDSLPKHPYANDCRRGMVAAGFDHETVDLVFLDKSLEFLEQHAAEHADQPFFLLHSTQAVHLPSFAGEQFQGVTNAGPHGDFIFELDYIVGQLMDALDKHGLSENTLVLFTSDNGPEVPTVVHMRRDHDHDGARPWRGVKRDNWEGGHRVPLIARWPGRVAPGTTTDATACLTDVMATCAELTSFDLPDDAAQDSFSLLPVLLGQSDQVREYVIHQTMSLALAIRGGNWKYRDHRGSGGNDYNKSGPWGMGQYALPETAPEAPGQLYDLASDPGETTNLYFERSDIVEELKQRLEQFKLSGRSRPVTQR
ncbi:MAG: sulfatase-like hydrolase/transferase [Pirellulaceae bacterium]